MGENLTAVGTDGTLGIYPAYRENTIQSFQQAAKCGVGFVEFDVQVCGLWFVLKWQGTASYHNTQVGQLVLEGSHPWSRA